MHLKILFLILIPLTAFSQTKYEKEVRLKKQAVPQSAKDFIAALPFTKKIKWYKEYGLTETSIEAKTKHQRKRYSIEFSPEGKLEDVEIKIIPAALPAEVLSKIKNHLQSEYKKFKIKKIQIQYSGDSNAVLAFLKKENSTTEIITRYELVVSARVEKSFKKFEYLFSEKGDFLKMAEIIEKNTDNIEF